MGKKLTYEEVKQYVEENGYELISTKYVRALNKLTFKCKNGHMFERTFAKFKSNKKCPYCEGQRTFTYSDVKEYIEKYNYTLLTNEEEYINSTEKIKVQCDKGHIYDTTFNKFKNGKTRCPYCAGNVRHTYEYVKEYIESFGYKLLSNNYVNANTHLKVQCDKGHTYKVKFGNFKTGYRCPYCDNSKGEKRIEDFLIKNNILFIPQKEYDNLLGLGGRNLSYDFYLPDYNLLIEFQGIQHQEYRKGFQKDYSEFEKQLKHDERKRKYAKEHNINLLEIWYYDFDNIENILINNLNLK